MLKNIRAAEILDTDMDAIRTEFSERGLSNVYNRLDNDIFKPYFPSENIQREFRQIAENIDMDNPFEEARDVLLDIQDDLRDLSFDDMFDMLQGGKYEVTFIYLIYYSLSYTNGM